MLILQWNCLQSLEVKELNNTVQRHEEKIKNMESIVVGMKKELHGAKEGLTRAQESHHQKEKHFQASKELVEKELSKVKKQLDSVQEQHVNQIQRLQESHARILASRDQQSSAHRLQVQQLQENESRRTEELSRCRAQVRIPPFYCSSRMCYCINFSGGVNIGNLPKISHPKIIKNVMKRLRHNQSNFVFH